MFKATEEIYDTFREAELNCKKETHKETSYVIAGLTTDLTNFDILYISEDDDNDVSMRIYDFVRFDESKTDAVLHVANDLNGQFRFVRFFVDKSDHTVTIEVDFPTSCENPGETAVEMFYRMSRIADEVYGEFMKAIWGS